MVRSIVLLSLFAACSAQAATVAKVGEPAPNFTLTDVAGTQHTLADLKGKTVVLEWFNPGCPFVVHAHEQGPLKDMASKVAGDDIVWLAINSGSPGKQGHGVAANTQAVSAWSMPNPVLIDEAGTVGKIYGAKTTPQMVVINPAGVISYAGALDNAPRGDAPSSGYKPWTRSAIDKTKAGQTPSPAQTQSWGCSVKY